MIRPALLLCGPLLLALVACGTPADERQGEQACTTHPDGGGPWLHADPGKPVRCGPQAEDPYATSN